MNEPNQQQLENLQRIKAIIESGYAGILPNGNIVDRRERPDAIPCPENILFNCPKPKKLPQ